MLLEMAIGDSYGIGWEFCPAQSAPNDLSAFHKNPKYETFPAGHYSDDTIRALANAQVVLAGERRWYQPSAYAEAYQAAYRANPREGWSRRFQQYLRERHDWPVEAFMRDLRRRPTDGAVMGVATLGFLPDEASIRLAATCQCVSTHSAYAEAPAQAIALAAHYFLFDKGPKSQLASYLAEQVDWADKAQQRKILCEGTSPVPVPAMPAWTIAACAITTTIDNDSLSEMLRYSIERGQEVPADTDSVAAVTLAIASCSKEVQNDLPEHLLNTLEDEAGRAHLKQIENDLISYAGLG